MIPKVIHYCWFGHNPLPKDVLNCISSWRKYCPEYEIRQWDESNFDVTVHPYVKEAYKAKKWAFVTDFARLYILEHEGGIYLDTDVELISSLDSILQHDCVLNEEIPGRVNTGVGFASVAHHQAVKAMLAEYDGVHFINSHGIMDVTPCPIRNTSALNKLGYHRGETLLEHIDCMVLPPEYMSPINSETGEKKITLHTVSIHHFAGSWKTESEKKSYCLKQRLQKKYGKIGYFLYLLYASMRLIRSEGIASLFAHISQKTRK